MVIFLIKAGDHIFYGSDIFNDKNALNWLEIS